MATKTHKWESDSKLVFAVLDGPAKGTYTVHSPTVKEHVEGNLVYVGMITLPTKRQRLMAPLADFPGLREEIVANERARSARYAAEAAARVHQCERCAEGIHGSEIVWNSERSRGVKVATPYCFDCARLLRIAAGGIGVAGESFSPADRDNTPETKGDFQ